MINQKIQLLLLPLFLLISCSFSNVQQNIQNLAPKEFKQNLKIQKGILIDVRTPEEFNEGHIPNAININVMSENFKEMISDLNKNDACFVYCRSGTRSAQATEKMRILGFKKIYNLEGGIIRWQKKSYNIVKE